MSVESLNWHEWGAEEVARYFTSKGFGEYANLWIQHRLTGERLVMMQPSDLQAMGIKAIGDRLGIQKELRALKTHARGMERSKVLAEFKQGYSGPTWLRDLVDCCGCCCPREPDKYTLTSSILKIRSYHINRAFGLRLGGCLGGQWKHDTIQLERIFDVDTAMTIQGFGCCHERKCWVYVSSQAGVEAESQQARVVTHALFLEKEDGERLADAIRHQSVEHRLELAGRHDGL